MDVDFAAGFAHLLASSLPRLPGKRQAHRQLAGRYKEYSFQLHTVSCRQSSGYFTVHLCSCCHVHSVIMCLVGRYTLFSQSINQSTQWQWSSLQLCVSVVYVFSWLWWVQLSNYCGQLHIRSRQRITCRVWCRVLTMLWAKWIDTDVLPGSCRMLYYFSFNILIFYYYIVSAFWSTWDQRWFQSLDGPAASQLVTNPVVGGRYFLPDLQLPS